jgi:hypothetical protein
MDTLTSMTADFPGNLVYKSLGRQLSISQIEDGLVVAT